MLVLILSVAVVGAAFIAYFGMKASEVI